MSSRTGQRFTPSNRKRALARRTKEVGRLERKATAAKTKNRKDIGHCHIWWGPGDRTIEKGDPAASGFSVKAKVEELNHCVLEPGLCYLSGPSFSG